MFIKRRIQQKILDYIKENGKAEDKELLEYLKKEAEISYNELLNLVMYLEIEGFIEVRRQKDGLVVIPKQAAKKIVA
ncbi:hypothetical protein QPL79_00225 [Ignisphaera sp. 4213-co]|uniref:Winged helix-turn-helix domain-containing protein n=1 Tax=Ignisphaera cupida TaxID=3050454 RepID=A0ABD4Z4W3_9CREN|nr:hypothetical protein [Ignisphaera sp. 4213-co]MDK6027799.1 hypothetical protein [Ignisphaera sp. 4213-co]